MCLHRVINTEEKPEAHGIGYKIMHLDDIKFNPTNTIWTGEIFGKDKLQGKEYTAQILSWGKNWGPNVSFREFLYPLGFHVFKTKAAARRWNCWPSAGKIVQVTWRHKLAEGTYRMRDPRGQKRDYKAVVTKYMTVVGEV